MKFVARLAAACLLTSCLLVAAQQDARDIQPRRHHRLYLTDDEKKSSIVQCVPLGKNRRPWCVSPGQHRSIISGDSGKIPNPGDLTESSSLGKAPGKVRSIVPGESGKIPNPRDITESSHLGRAPRKYLGGFDDYEDDEDIERGSNDDPAEGLLSAVVLSQIAHYLVKEIVDELTSKLPAIEDHRDGRANRGLGRSRTSLADSGRAHRFVDTDDDDEDGGANRTPGRSRSGLADGGRGHRSPAGQPTPTPTTEEPDEASDEEEEEERESPASHAQDKSSETSDHASSPDASYKQSEDTSPPKAAKNLRQRSTI